MSIHFYLTQKKVHGLPMTLSEESVLNWFEKNRFRTHVKYLIASFYANSQS